MKYSTLLSSAALIAISSYGIANATKAAINEDHETESLPSSSIGINKKAALDGIAPKKLSSETRERRDKKKEISLTHHQRGPIHSSSTIDLANLTATQGFVIAGASQYPTTALGGSVSAAGDINADGIADVVIGAYISSPKNRTSAGEAYAIYGKKGGYAKPIDLGTLNATQGFAIAGAQAGDDAGRSVGGAGDVNGDGIADVIIGAFGASPLGRAQAGEAYVIYGKKGGYANIDLNTLNAKQGFLIEGAQEGDNAGISVNGAGDINVDGITDVIIGAYAVDDAAGAAYVIYGKKGGYTKPIDLSTLDPSQGFVVEGAQGGDAAGVSVSAAGDINADGIVDIIIGAGGANDGAGAAYVIYGKKGGYANPIDLSNLNAKQGFLIAGAQEGDITGTSVSGAGDVNGDGIADVIIGASSASPQNRIEAGEAYVIYGKKGGYANPVYLNTLNAKQGFLIEGAQEGDITGFSVSGAGDANGDGIADVIIGAPRQDNTGITGVAGIAYVIYGKKGGYANPIDLNMTISQGFLIEGARPRDNIGWSVSGAGDVNADGITDVIIGGVSASPLNRWGVGEACVIYGNNSLPIQAPLSKEIENPEKLSNTLLSSYINKNNGNPYNNQHNKIQEALTSSASPLAEVPWASPMKWIKQGWKTLQTWWNTAEEKHFLSPKAQKLTQLKETYLTKLKEAPEGVHPYYHSILHGLIDNMEGILKKPETVTEEALVKFEEMLAQTQKDFIETKSPLTLRFNSLGNPIGSSSFMPVNGSAAHLALPALQTLYLGR